MITTYTSGLETKVFNHIKHISSYEWNTVFPNRLEGYDFFKTIEETLSDQFSFYYVMAYRDGLPVGAAPCFLMNYPLDTTIQGPIKKIADVVKKYFPSIFNLRALI